VRRRPVPPPGLRRDRVECRARTWAQRAEPVERLLVRRRRERAPHRVAIRGRHEIDRPWRQALEHLGTRSPWLEPTVGELLATDDAGEIGVDVVVATEDRDEGGFAQRGLPTSRDEEHPAADGHAEGTD